MSEEKLRLLIQELMVKGGNDTYIRENFRRLQRFLESSVEGTGGDTINNVTNVNNITQEARLEVDRIATGAVTIFDPVSLVSSTNVSTSNVDTLANATVFGVALNAAVDSGTVSVLIFGILEDASFTFTLNDRLFQSALGPISDQSTTIVGEFFCEVGKSNGTGSILISPGIPTEVL